jgi:AraC-like DNA-binding protein/mannose-6-phosphate isomerase-like protein (cupin superfamily)
MTEIVLNAPNRSTNPDDYQDVPRPVVVMAKDIPGNQTTGWHHHKRAQLVYASSGVIVVRTHEGTWVIPPQRAVWVPAGMKHETRTIGAVAMRTVYIAPRVARQFSAHCCVVNVSDLLRALILRAVDVLLAYERNGPDGRVMQMILDEIKSSRSLPLHLSIPTHQRLRDLCTTLQKNPQSHETLERMARKVGLSKRTAERLFVRETNITFSAWRQQARLLRALTQLAAGHSVKQAAFNSGYSSQSAFTSLFKRTFGTTPHRYFGRTDC